MFSVKRVIVTFTALAMARALLTPVPASAQQVPPEQANPYARGARAVDQLGERLPEVARANGLTAAALRSMLTNDPTYDGVGTVTVTNDQGARVAGATVTVAFSGDFSETLTGTKNRNGVATITTTARARKPTFSACVADASASGLVWVPFGEACKAAPTTTPIHPI